MGSPTISAAVLPAPMRDQTSKLSSTYSGRLDRESEVSGADRFRL